MTVRRVTIRLLAVAAVAALSAGCSGGNGSDDSGTRRISATMHQEDWVSFHGERLARGGYDCTGCHGEAFQGERGPACNACHGENSGPLAGDPALAALEFGESDGAPRIDHPSGWEGQTVVDDTIPFYTFEAARHGYVAKADQRDDTRPVGFEFCAGCHDESFIGRDLRTPPFPGPSANCLACHGNGTPHSPDLDEWARYHHVTTSPENASICAQCHENGASSPLPPPEPDPSVPNPCFNGTLCHTGSIVTTPIVDHFENHWEFHQRNPEACMICHGEDFQGRGEAPACFMCHNGSTAPDCTTCHPLPSTGGESRKRTSRVAPSAGGPTIDFERR